MEAKVDFRAIVEHRLIPARVRSEWDRLRRKGLASVWAPAADTDAEQLALTEQLIDAALGELSVVARRQPCMIVGDLNVEATKIPCLATGISAGSGLTWNLLGP